MKRFKLTGAALLALALVAPAAEVAEPTLAISATHVLVDGGTVVDDALVLIGEGRILGVGPKGELLDKLPKGVEVINHDGWLSSGLIAANATFGLSRSDDSTGAFMDEMQLAPGFNQDSKRLAAARELGITSFGLVSGRSNVIGGIGAIAKTDGQVVNAVANLSICLAPPALRGNRFPTSYGGALGALRARIADGKGALAAAAKSGKLPVQIAVNSRGEIARAIDFAEGAGLRTVLRGATRAGDFAADLKAAKMMVALQPIGLGASVQATDSMLALAKRGVPFAFGLADTSSASSLRESAALAKRAGLDRATAWNAVTATAAKLLGTDATMGRVAAGFDADLVLWSGDPLSITSRPVAVYVDGELSEGDKN